MDPVVCPQDGTTCYICGIPCIKTEQAPAPENIIEKPAHYHQFAIEPITFIMANKMEFWRGNIVKYASRAGSKVYDGMDPVQSEITDLKKIQNYAETRIKELRGEDIP